MVQDLSGDGRDILLISLRLGDDFFEFSVAGRLLKASKEEKL